MPTTALVPAHLIALGLEGELIAAGAAVELSPAAESDLDLLLNLSSTLLAELGEDEALWLRQRRVTCCLAERSTLVAISVERGIATSIRPGRRCA